MTHLSRENRKTKKNKVLYDRLGLENTFLIILLFCGLYAILLYFPNRFLVGKKTSIFNLDRKNDRGSDLAQTRLFIKHFFHKIKIFSYKLIPDYITYLLETVAQQLVRCQFHQRFMYEFFVRTSFFYLLLGFVEKFVWKMRA